MANFEEQGGKTQKRVPKWKNLLSLKNSSSSVPMEHLSKTESHIDKIIEKKRKKDKSKDEMSKEEEKKKKKNKHREKKQKVNYNEDNDRNENEKLPKQFPLKKKVTDSNSVLVVEQTKLKIPEEFIHAAKAGLNYLIIWRYQKERWKFQKTRQTWLLKNAYNEDLLSEDFFQLFLEYIAELSGKSRDTTLKIAQDVVNRLESEEQKVDETTDQKDDNEKREEQIKLNRAKAIVKILS